MKTEIVLLKGTVEVVKDVVEETLRAVARKLPLALEVVEDMSKKDEGLGDAAGGTSPSSFESLPSCSQENKDKATMGSFGRDAGLSQGHGASMLHPCKQAVLVDLGFWFAKPLEFIISLAPAPLGCGVGRDHSFWVRDGKDGFPDSSSCLTGATAKCTPDP